MSDTKLNTSNSIFNKLIKALLLATGALWIPLNIYRTNLSFLKSYFLFFVLLGFVLIDTFFTSIGASLMIGKDKAKDKMVRAITWVLGTAWGIHSYTLFSEHKYFLAVIASIFNTIMFILGLLVILSFAGFAIYYFIGKRNRN